MKPKKSNKKSINEFSKELIGKRYDEVIHLIDDFYVDFEIVDSYALSAQVLRYSKLVSDFMNTHSASTAIELRSLQLRIYKYTKKPNPIAMFTVRAFSDVVEGMLPYENGTIDNILR